MKIKHNESFWLEAIGLGFQLVGVVFGQKEVVAIGIALVVSGLIKAMCKPPP